MVNQAKVEKIIQRAHARGDISNVDEYLIREYIAEYQATSHISVSRVLKITNHLVGWRRFLKVEWQYASMGDIFDAITGLKSGNSLRNKPFAQNTLHDYIRILKPFLFWLLENKHNEKLEYTKIKRLKTPAIDVHTKNPADMLTQEDVQKLIEACILPRDKALLATIYETGGRVQEVGTLRWGDIQFDQLGCMVTLHDVKKPGITRNARLTWANAYLMVWKNQYPGDATDRNADVFLQIDGSPIQYPTIMAILRRNLKRAGITKHVTPHIFRHSRIHNMIVRGWKESVVKDQMWKNQNTKMMETYLRISEEDITREALRMAGINVPEAEVPKPLLAVICPFCHTQWPPEYPFCAKCGFPLNDEAEAMQARIRESQRLHPDAKAEVYMEVHKRNQEA